MAGPSHRGAPSRILKEGQHTRWPSCLPSRSSPEWSRGSASARGAGDRGGRPPRHDVRLEGRFPPGHHHRGRVRSRDPLSGFYVREVRHLSVLRLEIDGERPGGASGRGRGADELAFVFVHPELDPLRRRRQRRLRRRGHHRRARHPPPRARPPPDLPRRARTGCGPPAARHNRSPRRVVAARSAWVFAADYADLLEAQDGQRQQEAAVEREVASRRRARCATGTRGCRSRRSLTARGPGRHDVDAATAGRRRLQLAAGEAASTLELRVDAARPRPARSTRPPARARMRAPATGGSER